MEQIIITPMETNKDLAESFVIATVRNSYGIYAQRTIIRLIEATQSLLEGYKIGDCVKYQIDSNLWGERSIRMPISAILAEGDKSNYTEAKKQLKSLVQIPLEYEDDKQWFVVPLLSMVKFDKVNGDAIIKVQPEVWQAILDFSKGWRRFELDKALKLKSTYSIRLYQLLSGQESPISYNLVSLKKMLGVEKKYDRPINFINRVIIPAKEELDKVSPYTFDFRPILERKSNKGRAGITGITFFPLYQPKNRDKALAEKEDLHHLGKKYPGVATIPASVENYMIHSLEFTRKGLENNKETILQGYTHIDNFENFLRKLAGPSRNAKNRQGYILNAIRGELKEKGIKVN
jgi:hypothetical protein